MSKLPTRKAAIQTLTTAKNGINTAGSAIISVAETYQELHPEIGNPLYGLAEVLLSMEETVEKIRMMI